MLLSYTTNLKAVIVAFSYTRGIYRDRSKTLQIENETQNDYMIANQSVLNTAAVER